MNTLVVLVGVICILLGVGIGVLIRHIFVLKDLKQREGKADEIITKAKNDANDIKYNARKEAKDIIREEKQQADIK